MTPTRMSLGTACLLLMASCAGWLPPDVPDTTFAPGAAVQRAISDYYWDHGVEDFGRCTRPYFEAIQIVNVVDDTAERLVLDVHYNYWDRLRRDEDNNGRFPILRRICWGFETRQFTLAKRDGTLAVTEMTGPIRGQPSQYRGVAIGGGDRD